MRKTREELGADAGRLRDFQDARGVVDIESQTAAAVDVAKGLAFELSLKQVELSVLARQVAPDHPDRQALAIRVEELDRQLRIAGGRPLPRHGGPALRPGPARAPWARL